MINRVDTVRYLLPTMAITVQRSVFLEAITKHAPSSTAVVNHESGTALSYGTLVRDVARAKERLLQTAETASIGGERVAFLVENGYNYVGTKRILLFLPFVWSWALSLTMLRSHTSVDLCM